MTRRDFLSHTAAAGAALLGATTARGASARTPKNLQEIVGVKVAIATITMDGFGDKNFEPSFRMLPQLGIKNVEFNTWYPRNLTLDGIERIRQRSAEQGIRPICVQASAFGDGKAPDVAHKLWCMEAAKRLGARRVKFTGSKRGTNGGLEAVIGTLKELAPAAEEMGMLVLVENHASNVLENIGDYDEIFSKIDSPNVGLCLDTAHFVGAGVDLMEVVKRFHSRTLHVDLKDNRTVGGGHEAVPYGTGVVKFEPFLDELMKHGYSGYLLLELAHNIPKEPVLANLQSGHAMFKKYEA
ncbi:MAG TPA: sugar phosphate isomerase/epimerase family protein [Methylomirabilota bacterium]|nr:sugar phosphate isomerase/epimerase family protein [Methylomirabilota bacterium]